MKKVIWICVFGSLVAVNAQLRTWLPQQQVRRL